jgi:glycosyltransferase involved in cell wall biosynthesis
MSTKSLLYLSVYDPHVPLTGSGARGAEFVNNLARRFNLDLIYIDGSGQPPIAELSEKYASRITGVRSKVCINFSRIDYFLFSIALYKEALRLLNKQKYDFLICDYGLSATYGLLLGKKFHLPLVYISHNVEYLTYLQKARTDKRRLLLLPHLYYVEKQAVRKSAVLVAITGDDALHYTRWTNRDKMIIIPQCFEESIFNPFYEAPENNPKIVLFCGNYNIQFNRDAVNAVMERVLDKVLSVCPDTIFRFMGANPPKNIKHPNVEFTGFVTDYPAHLKQADVVISPMLQGGGFPTKMIEALACGKTIVATPVGARGIERDYQSLHICGLERFPDMICKALKSRSTATVEDFEKLKSRYAWKSNIDKLADRLESLAA